MENTFAEFKPIELNINPSKDQISKYYLDNNLLTNNNFLDSFLGLDKIKTSPKSNVEESNSIYNIREILSKKNNMNTPLVPEINIQEPEIITHDTPIIDKAKYAIDFFVNKGLTKEQASGIVGNLHAESKFNSKALGDNNSSFGIAQWHNERWNNLKDFANKKGSSSESFHTQLEFLWDELQTSENEALLELQKTRTISDAAKTFANKFERMKEYNPIREEMANHYFYI